MSAADWSLQSQIDKLYRRVLMTVAPTLIAATDDQGPIHQVQVRVQGTPETIDNVGVMQLYGIASHAPAGTDATALFMGGLRNNPIIIATGNQQARLKNQKPGEISLYTDEGDTIKMQRGNNIGINAKEAATVTTKTATINGSDNVNLTSPTTTVSQDLQVNRNVKADGTIDASGGFFQNGNPIGGSGGAQGPPGPAGPAGPAGPQGPAGVDGNTVLHGTGAPPSATGKDGDFYIDTTPHNMYGPKAGTWPTPGTSLIGPAGATGAQGPIGATGPAGPAGPQGPQGPNWTVGSGLSLNTGTTPSTIQVATPYLPTAGGSITGTSPGMLIIQRSATTPPAPSGLTSIFRVIGGDAESGSMSVEGWSTSNAAPMAILMRHARGTSGLPAATQNGDILGAFAWRGYGASDYTQTVARFITVATEPVQFGSTGLGAAIQMQTIPINGTTLATQVVVGPGLTVGAPATGGISGGMGIGDINAHRMFVEGNPVGTVASITAGTGLTGGTITASGTIALATVPLNLGGTGQTAAGAAGDAVLGLQAAAGTSALVRRSNVGTYTADTTAYVTGGPYLPIAGGQISGSPGSVVIGTPPDGSLGTGTVNATMLQANQNASIVSSTIAAITPLALRVAGADGQGARGLIEAFGANGVFYFRRMQGTAAAPVPITASGTSLGAYNFIGYNTLTPATTIQGQITVAASETWGTTTTTTSTGTQLQVSLVPNGSSTMASNVMVVDGGGNLTIAPGVTATKGGSAVWVNPSDPRLKDDIRPYDGGLAEIMSLEPVHFRYNGRGPLRGYRGEHIGLDAERTRRTMPSLVGEMIWRETEYDEASDEMREGPPETYATIDAGEVTWALVNAVKELAAEIEELRREGRR